MDSGNSGSMQSSSGGDEEYDSRTESISAFFNSTTSNLPPPPPTSHHPHPPFYDTLSYLDSNPNINPLLNLDTPWPPRTLRPSSSPNPNFTDIAGIIATSSFSPSPPQLPAYSSGITINPPPLQHPAATSVTAPRSSKKRSRASRRAPTTVLTTDTSNFRAMVQEFTGIPASPFAASSSPFPCPRFDLFHPSSSLRSSTLSDAPPPYILRPFAQKVHVGSTSSTTNPSTASSNSSPNTPPISITTSTSNYQLSRPPLNLQNPILNFQSLLTPKYTLPTMPAFAAARSQAPPLVPSDHASYGAGGDLGLPILIASEGMHSRGPGPGRCDELSGWAGGSVLAEHGGDPPQSRPAYGNSQRSTNCKLNYSAPATSDFHAEKGPESAPARGEGMMDSWICTSDWEIIKHI